IVTIRNEQRHIRNLLDSLVVQEGPLEVIVVDAESTDNTPDIVRGYSGRYPNIKLYTIPGTRGFCRNRGVKLAKGEVVAFVDGDCIANPFWLGRLREAMKNNDIVAGRTIQMGYQAFEDLGRVELYNKGYDVTFPSCNLAYTKKAFLDTGGFDDWFITAEDIDLNYRAVNRGYTIYYEEEAIIYHRARDTFIGFFDQAFWNGFGRKQLTMKHGPLWKNYNFIQMLTIQATIWKIVRLGVAVLGYGYCKLVNLRNPKYSPRDRNIE
ncbi:MAG: glycosyltransferase, partial [Thermoplasmata archaeon]|nr:glycosyltransferase [Thermoplasmata archaeon]